ncbi:hypothetical protein BDQ17DRAFT_1270817 [Cyathus striatus]|nr:hypothetical protein BDQ17DRAFT_1270817 [Cyathus striatus]
MGMTLPSPDSPMEQARALMARKDAIEAEISTQASVLKANDCNMQTPLVDAEGFPRADVDIYAVRGARVRIIQLRNDLKSVMDDIAKALEQIHAPSLATQTQASSEAEVTLKVFAKVNDVSPGSPASEAGLQRGDLIVKFGSLVQESFSGSTLQPLAELVAENENKHIIIRALRDDQTVYHTLTPRKGWGGRGLLGCHIIRHSSP